MTKLIQVQQLEEFSSSYNYGAATILPETLSKSSGGAVLDGAGSKRSAVSASEAECFSLCLGAGPLWCGPDVPVQQEAPPGEGAGGAAPAARTRANNDTNCELLTALLCGSKSSLNGSCDTLISSTSPGDGPTPHVLLDREAREQTIRKILDRKDVQPVKIDFKIFLTENTASRWEAVVTGSTLYLRLPGVLASGSKESFMALIDFAEERLGCKSCILCVRKSRPDRVVLLRTFMFMGFALIPPGSQLLPREMPTADHIYLYYSMQ